MSANTTIQEGGKGYPFGPVKCLMVEGDNGEFYQWYPETDRALDSLSVDKNGIYQASEYGVYGWSRVSVNVPQTSSVTGKDPQTGQEITVTTNPETGELVETVVPVEIRVIEPPTNPYGVYVDGQTITKDGMVVKAYDANGDEMQIVPIGELTINPTTASIDEAEIRGGGNIEGIPIINIALETAEYSVAVPSEFTVGNVTFKGEEASPAYGDHFTMSAHDVNYGWYYSKNSFPIKVKLQASANVADPAIFARVTAANGESLPSSGDLTMFRYTPGLPKYYQTITVLWPRPGDGAILETTFEITVGPRSWQGDD